MEHQHFNHDPQQPSCRGWKQQTKPEGSSWLTGLCSVAAVRTGEPHPPWWASDSALRAPAARDVIRCPTDENPTRSVIWKNDFLTLNRFIKLLRNQQKFRTSNESFIRMNSRREDCFHHTWRTPEGFNVSARRVCFNLEITARLNKTHLTGDKSWFVGTWCADYNLWPCLSFFWC